VEQLIQCLDEIEDIIYAAPLIAEQLRRAIKRILMLLGSAGLPVGGVFLALYRPPMALAMVSLLVVSWLMRAVVLPTPQTATTA
jgi:hypothetical protein